ncbi:MAG: DUF1499 domain-containing protein [Pseudomonadota bacterium]
MRWIAAIALVGLLAGCVGEGPNSIEVAPTSAVAPSSPNWALGAPAEIDTTTEPTHEVPIFATGPEELLGYLDSVALADDRVEAVRPAWTTNLRARAYVQRSPTLGFPDVISVEAVDLGTGDAGQRSSFVIYSRSVYGYSDLGVNGARLDRWLKQLAESAPVVAGRGLSQ